METLLPEIRSFEPVLRWINPKILSKKINPQDILHFSDGNPCTGIRKRPSIIE
jgi:hypothetical protein